jgi:heat shock protein HslJ
MRRRVLPKSLPVLVVGSVSAAVLAVSAATAVATISRATTASPLPDKIWVLASLVGKPPLVGTELTSEFTAKRRVSGSAGCNRYTGTYKVSGSMIRILPLATTRKACAEPIERQETAFLNALSRARSFVVSGGTLTLKSAGGQALATFKAQTQALAGTSWDVLAYNNGKQAVVSALTETKLTAVFGKSGSLTGFAGCNDYNAGYKASAPMISIGPVASTRKHCEEPAGVSEQETSYLAALATAATYRVEGSQLELRTTDGALAVQLHRK